MKKNVEESQDNIEDLFEFELDLPTEEEQTNEESEDQEEEEQEEESPKRSPKRQKPQEEEPEEPEESDDDESGDDDGDSGEEDEQENEEDDETEGELSPYEEALSELVGSGDFIINEDSEYEDSPAGVRKFIEDNLEHRLNKRLEGLSPTARKLIELEEKGADINEAFGQIQEFDFDSVDIDDEDTRKELMSDYYKALDSDITDEELEEKVQDMIDLGKDDKEATKAVRYFKKKQKERIEQYEAKVLEDKQARENEYNKQVKKIQTTVKKSDGFADIKFASDSEKESFLAYILERGEDGKTQSEKDDEDFDFALTRELYKFRKFNFKDIERKVASKKTVEVKKFLKQREDKSSSGRKTDVDRIKGKEKFDLGAGLPWLGGE